MPFRQARPQLFILVSLLAPCAALLVVEALCPAAKADQGSRQSGVIELRNSSWDFETERPATSDVTATAPKAEFQAPAKAVDGFTVKLRAKLKKFGSTKTILEIPDVLDVRLRLDDPLARGAQNYSAFKMPDGSVPVLEATVALHSAEHPDWNRMTVGFPLAMLKEPESEHEIVLNFSGVRWTMFVDGKLLDNDFPFGYPRWADRNTWTIDPESVVTAALYLPAITPEKRTAPSVATAEVQYWTPPGHNAWVGDVAAYFYQGRYHVFYLYDRRHHQSKFGQGAHYFEHLSTADFKTWTEHEAAVPLDEQWECIGTGTPFVLNGRFYLGYGLHTTRVYPINKTTLPEEWDYLKKYGRTGSFHRDTTPGVPAGSSYAVSDDGISGFKKSGVLFHPCENPSVYVDPAGRLRMLANYQSQGMWESKSVDGGWRCISPQFPPGGDCTFFFHWGQFEYIIGGFRNLWSKPANAPDSAFKDMVGEGLDFYDGSNVPTITEVGAGRFLMAAWIPIRGWGGPLVIRELRQFSDGRIGSKWMPEILPRTKNPRMLELKERDTNAFALGPQSFLLTFTVEPREGQKGRLGVAFMPANGEVNACELQLELASLRAQFANAAGRDFAPRQKSLREGGEPHAVRNYAIENLVGVDRPFTVRVVVKYSEKLGGSLVDVEIADRRTMITYRPDLIVRNLVFRKERIDLKDVEVAPLDSE